MPGFSVCRPWGLLCAVIVLTALLVSPSAHAQLAERMDPETVSTGSFHPRQLIAPGALLAIGTGVRYLGQRAVNIPVRDAALRLYEQNGPLPAYEYLRYLPLLTPVLDVGLGVMGVRAEHVFLDRVVEAGLAYTFVSGGALLMKKVINASRPDGSNAESFPSGHACFSFTGAELVRMEYGWGWGAGAYAVAVAVAGIRVYYDRHWLSDVLAGAGLGILAAHAGRWLLDPARSALRIRTGSWGAGRRPVQASLVPTVDPYHGVIRTSLALCF